MSATLLVRRLLPVALISIAAVSAAVAGVPQFSAPEIVKLDWSTRAMASGDVDGDGLMDIVLLNNDRSQVTLLYQLAEGADAAARRPGASRGRWEPVLEDAHFRVETISVGFALFDLALGDLNRDGRLDIIYTGREVPLTVRFQGEDGSWMDSAEYDDFAPLGWVMTVQVADINGDGFDQLAVLAADAIRLFDGSGRNEISEPAIYPITGENPFNLLLADVTGDGRTDLLFLSVDGEQSLALREQSAEGDFGPEMRSTLKRPSRMLRAIPAPEGQLGSQLVSVDARGGTMEFLALQRSLADGKGGLFSGGEVAPSIYPVPQAGSSRIAPSYALVDFDGDGRKGLAVADPTKAEILLYRKSGNGFRLINGFPSFSSVNSLSGGRFFEGRAEDLVVLSESEKTLGLSHFNERGRLEFPRNLFPVEDEPIVAAAFDLDSDGWDELVWVGKSGDDSYRLNISQPDDRKNPDTSWSLAAAYPLEGVRRAPSAISLLDTFASGGPGLMVFVPREPPVLLARAPGDGPFGLTLTAVRSPIRESLLKGVNPSLVSVFDCDGDGVKELVVGRTGFARAYRFADDSLLMTDQFNARRGTDNIGAVVPHFEGGVLRGMAFYIEAEASMQFLVRDEAGVFRYERSIETGRISPVAVAALADGQDGVDHLIFGTNRFWIFPSGSAGDRWQIDDRYETDLEATSYTHASVADFNGDGQADLLAIDGSANVADLLMRTEDGWSSRIYWEIFEQDMHYQGRKGANLEPREVLIEDFTGDGRPDLVFLVHDRLLMYPQE